MQDVIDLTVTPLSRACGAEIRGVDLTQELSERDGAGDQAGLGRASRPGVPRPDHHPGAAAALCRLFRRARRPQGGAPAAARAHRRHPAGPQEDSAGLQHQGRRAADRRLRRGRILVPHRFRLHRASLQIHLPACARAAFDRRQHHVRQHVQGLRGGAGAPSRRSSAARRRCTSTSTSAPRRPTLRPTSATFRISITRCSSPTRTPAARRCSSTA